MATPEEQRWSYQLLKTEMPLRDPKIDQCRQPETKSLIILSVWHTCWMIQKWILQWDENLVIMCMAFVIPGIGLEIHQSSVTNKAHDFIHNGLERGLHEKLSHWQWDGGNQGTGLESFAVGGKPGLTLAIWSNFPKSSFSMCTSSPGEQSLASRVNPTMSAYKMLGDRIRSLLWKSLWLFH